MSRLLLAGGLFLTGVACLSADDIDRILGRDKLAAEKLLSDASAALSDSVKLEKTSPGVAVLLLEKRIGELREASFLPEVERSAWIGKLQARLRSVQDTLHAAKLAAEEKATRDAEEVFRKMREAERKKGSGVSSTAKAYLGSVKDQVEAAERLRREGASRTLSVFRDIEATATIIPGVVEFPKHWARITDSPYRGSGKKLHPKEVALLKTLNSTMSADFDMRRLREVIDYIQEKTGIAIFMDKLTLEEAGVDYDTPVTFKAPRASVRTILKKILAENNLTYIIKEGALQVMTPQKAREQMVVRTYPVSDILGNIADPRFDPYTARAIMYSNVMGLVKTLQSAIDPALWDINGGPGSIMFHEPTMSLIVRAPAEMHYMLGGGSMFK